MIEDVSRIHARASHCTGARFPRRQNLCRLRSAEPSAPAATATAAASRTGAAARPFELRRAEAPGLAQPKIQSDKPRPSSVVAANHLRYRADYRIRIDV